MFWRLSRLVSSICHPCVSQSATLVYKTTCLALFGFNCRYKAAMDLDWEIECASESLPKISDLIDPSVENGLLETVELVALCERDEKATSSLRLKIDELKRMRSKVDSEKNRAQTETLKLSTRFNSINAERESLEIQKGNLESLLKNLIIHVDELEQDKENKTGKLKSSFERYANAVNIYQKLLDINVEASEGDIYTVQFSRKGAPAVKLTLRSANFKDWEVVDVCPRNSNTFDRITSYLTNTNDVVGLMCQARNSAES
ncbi:Hypothetical protein NTJ_02400 [Nesidiocoris tenuis]|uniref:Kinetochore protein SPC25 n=1 Tax=Nesidiocoris tenuis TaxID=355587 RepID=A0ABN7ABB4_9HEMI|nr:Hypothetical protein NTJ_02400 [Nesidiocoris tenuis]